MTKRYQSATPPIRPPDPAISGPTRQYMPVESAEAIRRICDLAYRDCWTALDVTYGAGRFWADPPIPGLHLATNARMLGHPGRDFTATGYPAGAFDLVTFDPPHIADGGRDGIMAKRYGTYRGVRRLKEMIDDGCRESARVARLGVIVKVADHAHGGEFLMLSAWVQETMWKRCDMRPYFVLHTYRERSLADGKWRVRRVPRCNGAVYLAFRRDSQRHRTFDHEYARQEGR